MAVAVFGAVYGAAGKIEEAKRILEELEAKSQKQHVSPYWIGVLYDV